MGQGIISSMRSQTTVPCNRCRMEFASIRFSHLRYKHGSPLGESGCPKLSTAGDRLRGDKGRMPFGRSLWEHVNATHYTWSRDIIGNGVRLIPLVPLVIALLVGGSAQDPQDSKVELFKRLVRDAHSARKAGKQELAKELDNKADEIIRDILTRMEKAERNGSNEAFLEAARTFIELLQVLLGRNAPVSDLRSEVQPGLRMLRRIMQLKGLPDADKVKEHFKAVQAARKSLSSLGAPEGFQSIVPPPVKEAENMAWEYSRAFELA